MRHQVFFLAAFISTRSSATPVELNDSITRQSKKEENDISTRRVLQNTNGLLDLSTSFSGTELNYGSMFEIVSLKDIIIYAFDVHTISEDQETIEVYNRGSALGALRSPGAWKKISIDDLAVQCQGEENPTSVQEGSFSPIYVPSNSPSSFYITFLKQIMIESAIIGGSITGDVFASNDDAQLKLGVGKVYPFANNDFNRLFNGAIYYREGTLSPTLSPTSLPSVAPTGVPTQSSQPSSSPTTSTSPTNNFLKLSTTLSGDQNNNGHMFNIVGLTDIVIQAFDVHTASTNPEKIEIYNREGILGSLRSPGAWMKISVSDLEIVGKGKGSPSAIPEGSFTPTYIAPNTSYSFYITFLENVMIESAVLGLSTGAVLFQNTDLQFKVGVGKAYPFANTDQNRVFNGVVYYSRNTLPPTPGPTAAASEKPSDRPSVIPSSTPSKMPSVAPTQMASSAPSISLVPTNNYLNLPTTFSGDQTNYGNMFELTCLTDILIEAFDVHTSAQNEIEVVIYYRKGALGALRSPGAWTNISIAGLKVVGKGNNTPTRIPEGSFSPTYIAPDTSASFYITFKERIMIESAVIGISTGTVLFQNADVQFKVGVGKAYPFANTDQNRVFNGAVYYSQGTLAPTSAPTSSPTISPSSKPTTTTGKPTSTPTGSPSTSIAPTNIYPGLTITFSGDQRTFGNMFELVSRDDIIIRAFDVHSSAESEKEVEVYYRNGALGALRTPGAWTKISTDGLKVSGKGKGAQTHIPSIGLIPKYIAPNTSASFYITFQEKIMIESAVIGISTGSVLFQNTDLQCKVGVGKVYSFANTDLNRIFNGVVYYSQGTFSPTSIPTSVPSFLPTLRPTTTTKKPTSAPTAGPSISISPTNSYPDLKTTYSGDQSNYGNMFELVSQGDIIIQAFDVHSSAISEKDVEIYSRGGALSDFRSPGAWAKISLEGLKVTGKGKGSPTHIPAGSFTPQYMADKISSSFYITFVERVMIESAVIGLSTGMVLFQNADLQYKVGVGKVYKFANTDQNRIFNGAVYYSRGTLSPTSAPTSSLSMNPTSDPSIIEAPMTKIPTGAPSSVPSFKPSIRPSTNLPTSFPTRTPTNLPTSFPTPPEIYGGIANTSLTTTFDGGSTQDGNMFDVVAKRDILISNMDIHTSFEGSNMIEIYSRGVTWSAVTIHPTAWTKVSVAGLQVMGNGVGVPTPLPENAFDPLYVSGGATRSFYVTTSNGRYMQQTPFTTGDVISSNNDLSIYAGVGKNYLFLHTEKDMAWNGNLYYTSGSVNPQSKLIVSSAHRASARLTYIVIGALFLGRLFL
mmetsp:Transcript_200/g.275  ORF Transcript_200/g.275 Transcript_200/m.275 type:complete len:1303 (-) Transcript_200:158-4066(-)|eukprot:CAMPEP_0116024964 /NCGR_PEP_ID=MMETSP0321-20121206/12700_1 /TAXON_ID=163516 /ORGANISM="Leptocylindrus danicus var. danicus, Strain B650" /LENGTH=1302 /DNA_ID=CAMNT_0003496935 /DNA_START=267 /DNA_END=4175 /DNA_ORIENTATION=-